MSMMYEYVGVVEKVKETQTFSNGFSKRILIVTDDVGVHTQWPACMIFTFKKDRTTLLDGVAKGQRVKVTFAIDGREWVDQQGNEREFVDLAGIKLDVLANEQPTVQKPVGETVDDASNDIPPDCPI